MGESMRLSGRLGNNVVAVDWRGPLVGIALAAIGGGLATGMLSGVSGSDVLTLTRAAPGLLLPLFLTVFGGVVIFLLTHRRRQLDERVMLLRVGRAAASSLELHTVLAEIARASLGIAGTECCSILIDHPDDQEFEIGADETVPSWPGTEEPGTRISAEAVGSDRLVMAERKARRFDRQTPDLPESERDHMCFHGTESVVVVPLLAGETCLGTLNLLSRRRGVFDSRAIRLGEEIAAQTALAIHNAQLLGSARRHAEEQAALLRVSRAVSSSLRLGDVMSEVARASLGVAGAESCEIELWHPETDDTELVAQHHVADWLNCKTNVGARFPLSNWPLTRQVLMTREPMIIGEDAPALTDYERETLFNDDSRSGFAVPIVVDNRSLGILSLYSRRRAAFNARAVTLGQDLANQAALAIERARLHAALEERARTDGLTGVLNRGAIQDLLESESHRARRSGLPLAVLLVDLDGFKRVNDQHGHLAGDRVLREVARTLQRAVREGDAVGRYGGDEFLAVLPDADLIGATVVADRIRWQMASSRVPLDGTAESLPITLSLGQAVFPHDGSTGDDLLDAADRSMYAAKHRTLMAGD